MRRTLSFAAVVIAVLVGLRFAPKAALWFLRRRLREIEELRAELREVEAEIRRAREAIEREISSL